jgi:hypothetical protein
MSELVEKLFAVHDALTDAGLAHAFGGAIALAYCTEEPRGAREFDVHIFAPTANAERALAALPEGLRTTAEQVGLASAQGHVRTEWDGVPLNVYFKAIPFHDAMAERVVWVALAEREVPVVDCASLVVSMALSGTTRDLADIEAVAERTPDQVEAAAVTLGALAGGDAARDRLASILTGSP